MAEEIELEKCNFQNFRSPMTLTLDRVIRHTVGIPSRISHRPLSTYQISLKSEITFCYWTDGRMYRRMYVRTDIPTDGYFRPPLMLLGQLGRVDLKINYRTVFELSEFGFTYTSK